VPPRVARAGTRQRFGDPQGSFTGWEIDEPFGTDMVLVLVSDDPGFLEARPEIERGPTNEEGHPEVAFLVPSASDDPLSAGRSA
jgi:hypothetical protein